ncbi:hypothetical protein HMPREF9997_01569 [Corynebacterium durum F0235]|uniref:Uncharacterized protein n=1 Tax=Corynebacterium durum F0235 TaxID=1035195 RepID=L1MHF3_9CORY|nr:hypothetical protein HMPREF9997_01569 [Corynebacterium durum F0235]
MQQGCGGVESNIGYGATGTHPPWFLFPQRFHSTFSSVRNTP